MRHFRVPGFTARRAAKVAAEAAKAAELERQRIQEADTFKIWLERVGIVGALVGLWFAITAYSEAVRQNQIATDELRQQGYLNAYDLLVSGVVSAGAKWRILPTVMERDFEITDLSMGCNLTLTRDCDVHAGLTIGQTLDAQYRGRWHFTRLVATGQRFDGGKWQNLRFKESDMRSLTLWDVDLDGVDFYRVALDEAEIRLQHAGAQNVTIGGSSLRWASIDVSDGAGLEIIASDLSGAFFNSPTTGTLGRFDALNYYVRGRPPFDRSGPAPMIAGYLCDKTIFASGEPANVSGACRPIRSDWQVVFDYLARR